MKRRHGLFLMMVLLITVALSAQMAAAVSPPLIFDDMEHGDPYGSGWFSFGGSVGGGGIGPNTTDLPPIAGGSFSLETGWGGGGPGFFGGFGRTFPVDLQGKSHFTFWINPDAGQDYTLEINLQDDDNGDDAINAADDDEFQYNCTIAAAGPCATAGGGWQLVSIPLAAFFHDTSTLVGGSGVLDPVPASEGGNGQLVNVIVVVISNSGADATFRTDNWAFADLIVDDFENGLPSGVDGDGNAIGFYKFEGPGAIVDYSTTDTPPVQVPGAGSGNHVLEVASNVPGGSWGGVVHAFENEALDTWTPQDWSMFEGISFWLYGHNTGKTLFIDLLDNRAPGSTGDTAERFSIDIPDDFAGWQFFEIPFGSLNRKEVGNGAPNDGLTLTEVHGWAFGVFDAGQAFTNYLDDVALYGVAELPPLSVNFSLNETKVNEGDTAAVAVKLNRALGSDSDDPQEVSIAYSTEAGSAVAGRDFTPTSGVLTFTQGGPSELTFPVETFANPKHDGDKTVILRLSDPLDVELGVVAQSALAILDTDPLDGTLIDDFERGAYLWEGEHVVLTTPEVMAGDPLAVPGQGAYEHFLQAEAMASVVEILVQGSICNSGNGVVPVAILTTDNFDALTVDHNTVTFGDAVETHRDKKTGDARRHEEDVDGDGDLDLLFHFRASETGYTCEDTLFQLTGETFDGQPIIYGEEVSFNRDFAIGQDWSGAEALSFWYYGTNSSEQITLQLKDNRAPDPGPASWSMVWNDEFDDPAGTPPDPAAWSHEIGDGAANRNPGWGNQELQYYTTSTQNSATDGQGNLVITAKEADGSLLCYYGPCDYTSARLISQYKAEFAYGRIESRMLLPDGAAGLWPAFWSLGTDIAEVDWPQTGEIDFMEYVSRIPNEVFGTIHGPGYSGGQSFGSTFDFGGPASAAFHTYTIEWEPDVIRWYVDGQLYFTATPDDIAPNQWVFNDPVFIIFNMAIGGNFGGEVSDQLTFPQEMVIDYLRVYQGPDTAERWQASFVDNFSGWQQVEIPFAELSRSAMQPDGAPDDGLTLSEVWGYGFALPGALAGEQVRLDQVRLELPAAITVTNLNDSGPGSLRQALTGIAAGGTITFDPALAGGTILLTSGPLVPGKSVTIDAAGAPGLSLNGNGSSRLLEINPGLTVNLAHLVVTNGLGWDLAGGILNNGTLNITFCEITGNVVATASFDPNTDYWKGGGGIYNGDNATLLLADSTVSDNNSQGPDGGGIYASIGSTMTILRSTISGNSGNTGGAIRHRGDLATIVNSTISGNTSTGWYGSAIFDTDGVMELQNSTVTANVSPDWGPAALAIANYGGAPVMTLTNTIVAGNTPGGQCAPDWLGGFPVLTGVNLFSDASCNPGAGDIIGDPNLGALADNGGPTWTHALLTGSPAVDAADNAFCPATDQRGVSRDTACDIGAFEFGP